MEYLEIILIIFTISIPIANIFKKKIDMAIPLTAVAMSIFVYIPGIFDNLNIGMTILKIITIICGIYDVIYVIKKIKEKTLRKELGRFFTPGLCAYLGIYMACISINYGRMLEHYDDFNHWGAIVKNMFLYNGYGTIKDSIITFNEYPPFTANFQYILVKIKGIYSEDDLLIAQNLMYLSIIMPVFESIDWNKNLKKMIATIPTVVFIPMIFYDIFYSKLLLDEFIGIVLAMAFYVMIKEDDKKYRNWILMGYLIALGLSKTTGVVLMTIFTMSYFLYLNIKKVNRQKRNVIYYFVPIILVTIWYIKINIGKSGYEWDFSQIINIEKLFSRINILKKFFQVAIFEYNTTTIRYLSFAIMILLLVSYSIIVSKYVKNKKCYKYIISVIFISTIIYALGLIWMYMSIFNDYESNKLICFNRYMCTMYVAWTYFNSIVFCENADIDWKKIIVYFSIIYSFLPTGTINVYYINKQKSLTDQQIKRNFYTQSLNEYEDNLTKNDKIFFLCDDEKDPLFVTKINRYVSMKLNIGNADGSYIENLEQQLEEGQYKYFFVYSYSDEFKEKYGEMFYNTIYKKTLYKIDYENGVIHMLKAGI